MINNIYFYYHYILLITIYIFIVINLKTDRNINGFAGWSGSWEGLGGFSNGLSSKKLTHDPSINFTILDRTIHEPGPT